MIEDTGFGEGAVYDPDGGEGTEGTCSCTAYGCGCTNCDTAVATQLARAWQASVAVDAGA